jgi:Nucleotidyltransferase domain
MKRMPMPPSLDLALDLVRRYGADRFPHAAILLAGSVARGTATPASDLDLVLLFDRLSHAWRETVTVNGLTVELFAHDRETLAWFFEQDRVRGTASLASMVSEGVPVTTPATDPSPQIARAKAMAAAVLAAGPPPLSQDEIDDRRYRITDLAQDLSGGGTPGEIFATAASLYQALGDLTLRAAGAWSGGGKALAQRLERHDPALALRLEHAFGALFRRFQAAQILGLVEELLAPLGGPLAQGYYRPAPPEWRRK